MVFWYRAFLYQKTIIGCILISPFWIVEFVMLHLCYISGSFLFLLKYTILLK